MKYCCRNKSARKQNKELTKGEFFAGIRWEGKGNDGHRRYQDAWDDQVEEAEY